MYVDSRPLEVMQATCSADKARKLLGYRTKTTLETGLQKMIQYIQTQGPKPFQYNRPIEIKNNLTPKTWSQNLI